MAYRARAHMPWTRKIGPLKLNGNKHRLTSWGFELGPITWNNRSGWTIDTPGRGYVKLSKKNRRK
ncbi:hypothetical protein EIL87_19820 [Saccharopolyspora rhizosphaerae]|uniref:DUF4236 domain-containing protein n=1 Tax=Saccharopolyspora rhizosphaerae TaxID=2492662 RepID=A0A3R8PYE0_9PSEU|nr:hypothetical protein [Saccharopolyspora rhizosphaerae]RRO14554.1 hypothetical protein EIL87_19820 [Saccharopolyspora rhizosphaerae]